MAVGDGSAWDETNPTNSTLATSIDDYDRDLRVGIRSRMSHEHEWPSSQSATNQAGQHKFITLQQQSTKPTVSGTQLGAVYMKTVGSGLQELFWENEAGTEVQLTYRSAVGGQLQVVSSFVSTMVILGSTPLFAAGTTPTTTAGNLFVSKSITPKSTSSRLKINCFGDFNATAAGVANRVGMALFKDTTASALAVTGCPYDQNYSQYGNPPLNIEYIIASPGTTSVTFYVRAGLDTSNACAFNFANAMTGSLANGTAGNGGIIIEELI